MAERVCPVWVGYLLLSPLRKWLQNPARILQPHVSPGMTVIEVGPAMGFFSIPLAQMIGPDGRLICIDVQEGMLRRLRNRAEKAGVAEVIETRLCPAESLGIDDLKSKADFALLFAVAHEVPGQQKLFIELSSALKPGGTLLLAEPRGHVKPQAFEQSLTWAKESGLEVVDRPKIRSSQSALLRKQ